MHCRLGRLPSTLSLSPRQLVVLSLSRPVSLSIPSSFSFTTCIFVCYLVLVKRGAVNRSIVLSIIGGFFSVGNVRSLSSGG